MAKKLTAQQIARYRQNPGLRSKLPDKYLTAKQRQQRATNLRLNSPIVEGSTITGRDLAHQADTATRLKYGQQDSALTAQLGNATALKRDTADWYDAYKNELATHAENVKGINAGAVGQIQGLAEQVKGLDQSGRIQSAADAEAAQRGGTAGDLSVTASNAAAIRQAMLAAAGSTQASQGAASNTYSDTLARVVAPGQKLSALAQSQGKINDLLKVRTDLAGEKGAYNSSFRDTVRDSETKNVLSAKALGLNAVKAQSTAQTANARVRETQRHNRTAESIAAQRAARVGTSTTSSSGGRKTPAGRPVNPATANAADFYAKYGVKPAATAAIGNARDTIQSTQNLVKTIRSSNPHLSRAQLGALLLSGQAADKASGSIAVPKQKGLWATVALDQAFLNGRVSAGTAKKLHQAGYSVKLLGLKT